MAQVNPHIQQKLTFPDIDPKSLEFANKNILLNNLQSRIRLLMTVPEGPLLPLNLFQIDRYLICILD
jgi:hypothetical protein